MAEALVGVPGVGVYRGGRLESLHSIAYCVSDVEGTVIRAAGNIDTRVYPRSSAKPFIAAAAVRAGVLDRFAFGDRELAVMCASHDGEPGHTELVASMLARIGASVDDLQCGTHAPYDARSAAALAQRGEAPSALHNNCSGKHAGILALARIIGAPLDGYLDAAHPAQRAILELCERVTDDTFGASELGVDGCGIPAFATTLRKTALAFARMATLRGLRDDDATALARVSQAMGRQPWFVSGTSQFDTELISATGGRVVGKSGAEGFHGDALLDFGVGFALKVIDGHSRALPAATLAVLDALGALTPEARSLLSRFARPQLSNVAKRPVGEIVVLHDWLQDAGIADRG